MSFSIPSRLRTASGATRAILAIVVPVSTLALGSLHTPVLCAITAVLAVGVFIGWYNGSPYRSRLPATIVLFTGVALTAFTALQALPLPAILVRLVAPSTADTWSRALWPLGEAGPSWTALSLDPTATRVQVVRGVAYIAAFLLALRVADRHGGSQFLAMTVGITACVLSVSAILHPMFGLKRVFGVYEPVNGILDRHVAPLLNPNHLAAYINIGFCLTLGIVTSRRREKSWPIVIAMLLVLLMTQLWVGSRGGTLAMIFGAVVVLVMARLARRFVARSITVVVLPTLVIAAGIAMAVVGMTEEAAAELGSLDVQKIGIALEGLRLVPQHALFGVGRGAFESAFPMVRTIPGYMSVTHPENIVVQWVTEWGLPVSIAAAAALGYAFRPKVLAASSSPAVGAWAALAAVVVQNLVDFNSEVPAIGIACAVCGAMIVTGRGSTSNPGLPSWAMHPRRVAIGVGVAALATIAIALPATPNELENERIALYDEAIERTVPPHFGADVRDALARHPAEPYIPFIASIAAARAGRSTVPWVERTLELSPVYAPAHLVLAQQIAGISPAQARLEYRLVLEQTIDDRLDGTAIRRARPLLTDFDSVLELVPDGKKRISILDQLAQLLRGTLPASSARIDEMIRRLAPNERGPLERTIADTLTDIMAGDAAPWCVERTSCTESGLAAVQRLIALEPSTCAPLVLRARLLVAADDAPRGLHDLEAAAKTATDASECWQALGSLGAEVKSETYVNIAEAEISRAGCVSSDECATNQLWVAELEMRRGNPRRALGAYARALDLTPERTDLLERVAALSSSLGNHAEARMHYERLAALTNDGKYTALADREKAFVYRDLDAHSLRRRDAGADLDLLDKLGPVPFSVTGASP